MSYRDILELVDQTLDGAADSAHGDVMAFLRQYAVTLRRNIVSDISNDVHQLVRRVYRKHQKAIDLISKHQRCCKPNYLTEASALLGEAINHRPDLWRRGRSNYGYFRFLSAAWADYPSIKLPEWPNHLLLFQVHVTESPSHIKLYLTQGGDESLRRKVFDKVKQSGEPFECGQADYTDELIALHTFRDLLTDRDYEEWWNEEEIQRRVSARLEEFASTQLGRVNEVIVQCLEEHEAERVN